MNREKAFQALSGLDDSYIEEAIRYAPEDAGSSPGRITHMKKRIVTLALAADNTVYEYGELTALTVTAIPASGAFILRFTSGATATVLTLPNTLHLPDGFTVKTNTRYEINVADGYALCAGWAVSAS